MRGEGGELAVRIASRFVMSKGSRVNVSRERWRAVISGVISYPLSSLSYSPKMARKLRLNCWRARVMMFAGGGEDWGHSDGLPSERDT